jgi:cytochrome P450
LKKEENMIAGIFTVVGLSLLAVGIAYGLVIYLMQMWTLRSFKGPLALPFVGNCYNMESLFVMKYLSKLRKRFGKIFSFFAFTKSFLVVCEPVIVRRILSDSKTFVKGSDYTQIFGIAFGQSLVTSNGEKHRADRAILGKFFVRSNISKYMPIVNAVAAKTMKELLQLESGKATSINVEEYYAVLALRVFLRFMADYSIDNLELERKICHWVSSGSALIGKIMLIGLPSWSFLPPVKDLKNAVAKIWTLLFKPMIKNRKERIANGEELADDCLGAMLACDLSEQELCDHLTTLMSAGHDTTAYFSSYMTYLLANHPDVQDKLRTEINETLGDRTDVTAEDVSNMKYFHKIMQESLRLYSVIPFLTRHTVEDTYIKEADVRISKGSNILVPMFLINRDPEIWENPNDFIPERFEGRGDFTSAKNGFFPFAYGSRTCIGNTLAQMESCTFLCHLLRQYRLIPEPGFKPSIVAGISLTTSNGIRVMLEKL